MLPAGEARDGGAELVLEVLDGVEPVREGGREVGQERRRVGLKREYTEEKEKKFSEKGRHSSGQTVL